MTYTKQTSSLFVIDKPGIKNTDSFPDQPVKTGNPEADAINDNLI